MTIAIAPEDRHNLQLVANVHPPDWSNPQPAGPYNLVVIGAGTAGLVCAAGAATLGARVALVERNLMGGDCLNYGCVPSKAVIRAARAAYAMKEASQYGVGLEGRSAVDFGAVMERMRRLRAEISVHDSVARFSGLGADVYLGDARFVAPEAIEVDGRHLKFSKAVIATGGRAADPAIPGLKEAGFLTNESVFSLTTLPSRLIVFGAGPIGCELAQSFRRLGSDVTMLTDGTRLVPREDDDAAALLQSRFEREGIRLSFRAKIQRVERRNGVKTVVFEDGDGGHRIEGDQILVAVGRVPNVEGLDLGVAGVRSDKKGVHVDDRLRTSNPRIYAAGDICSPFKFTHAAEAMARIVVQNALFFGRKRASKLVIPWCTYTDPEIAHVGMYEREARQRGMAVEVFTKTFDDIDRAVVDGETEGFARLIIDKSTGRILGATMVGTHAGESIGEAALAISEGMKVSSLSGLIHPYPTQAESWKRAADLQFRSRLKPWMKDLLVKYFQIRR